MMRKSLAKILMRHIGRFQASTAAEFAPAHHKPVLLEEVIDILKPRNGKVYIDMTFGAGGHSKGILSAAPKSTLFCLDRDPVAYEMAQEWSQERSNVVPLLGNFSNIHHLVAQENLGKDSIDGILFDVGASSMQFDNAQRGFSCSMNGPLDMRMDPTRENKQPSAADVVNYLDEIDLFKIIHNYGEEKHARLIARAIVEHRLAFGHIKSTKALADIIQSVYQISYMKDKLQRSAHVATKTFQALRIFVNNELNELHNGLELAHWLLKQGGVCVVISFHSLEDRIVKRHFHAIEMDAPKNMSLSDKKWTNIKLATKEELTELMKKKWKPLAKKVLTATEDEILVNPRARSAKLRAAVKENV